MSKAIDPARQGLSEQQLRDFYAYCLYCEADGNRGGYDRRSRVRGAWILEGKYKHFRDGILFYSRGWGWRLRKKPHWKTVFAERFPNTYALIFSEEAAN